MRFSPEGVAVYRRRLKEVGEPLSMEERLVAEKAIAEGCQKARHKLILACTRFAAKRAFRWHKTLRFTVPLEDLIQEANLGLVMASYKFDPSRGASFLTFANLHINKCILISLCRSSVIGVPHRHKKTAFYSLRGDDRESSESRVIPAKKALGCGQFPQDDPESETPFGEHIDPSSKFAEAEELGLLETWIESLPKRHSWVLRMRYGIGEDLLAVRDIAKLLGVTGQTVRNITEEAIEALRKSVSRYGQLPPMRHADMRVLMPGFSGRTHPKRRFWRDAQGFLHSEDQS